MITSLLPMIVGAAILLASHNMEEVERICSDVIMLRAGSMVDRGPPNELIARYGRRTMEEVFLAIARNEGGAPPADGLPPAAARANKIPAESRGRAGKDDPGGPLPGASS